MPEKNRVFGLADSRELPIGVDDWYSFDEIYGLTTEARLRGYHLIRYGIGERSKNIYVLYDRWYHILKQWPDGYAVCWQDILDYCNQNPA